jgi:anti-anti-sigma factor
MKIIDIQGKINMDTKFETIELTGILDGIKGNELRREVSEIIAKGTDVLLIDLKDVNFINSSGLGSLVSSMQIVRDVNAKLFVCSINDQVKMLFELTKMDKIFKVYKDKEDFVNNFLTANNKI